MNKLRSCGFGDTDVEMLFRELDSNNDGTLTLEEVTHGLIHHKERMEAHHRGTRMLTRLFKSADVDGNGVLSWDEFLSVFKHNPSVLARLYKYGLDAQDIDSLFAEMDENNDGSVSLAELLNGFQKKRDKH